MELSSNNILYLQHKGQLKKLAAFIILKGIYSNSCIFNYNIKSLSVKSGLTRHQIRTNVKFFIDNGWCYLHGNNLMFRKYDKIAKGVWVMRDKRAYKGKSIKEIVSILLSLVLKDKEVKFNWIQEKKRDLKKSNTTEFIDLKDYKKALKAQRKYGITTIGESDNFKITMLSIGNLFGVSKSTASNIIKSMQRMNLVRVTGYYPEYIGPCTTKMWKALEGVGGIMWLSGKNMVFKTRCNEYSFF